MIRNARMDRASPRGTSCQFAGRTLTRRPKLATSSSNPTDHGRRTTDNPHGFTLFELSVTMILLGVMAGTLVPLLGHAARLQRETDRRQTALYEAHNLLERLVARPWDELTPAAAQNETLPETCRDSLPDARLTVAIDQPAGDEQGAKRIAVEIRWRLHDGTKAAPVRVVTWRFRQSGETTQDAS